MADFPPDHFSQNMVLARGLVDEFERFRTTHQLSPAVQGKTLERYLDELMDPSNKAINQFFSELKADEIFQKTLYERMVDDDVSPELPKDLRSSSQGSRLRNLGFVGFLYFRLLFTTLRNVSKWIENRYGSVDHWFRLLQSESGRKRGDNLKKEIIRAARDFRRKQIRDQPTQRDDVSSDGVVAKPRMFNYEKPEYVQQTERRRQRTSELRYWPNVKMQFSAVEQALMARWFAEIEHDDLIDSSEITLCQEFGISTTEFANLKSKVAAAINRARDPQEEAPEPESDDTKDDESGDQR